MFEYVIDFLTFERDMLKNDMRYYGVTNEAKGIIKDKINQLQQAIKILKESEEK